MFSDPSEAAIILNGRKAVINKPEYMTECRMEQKRQEQNRGQFCQSYDKTRISDDHMIAKEAKR